MHLALRVLVSALCPVCTYYRVDTSWGDLEVLECSVRIVVRLHACLCGLGSHCYMFVPAAYELTGLARGGQQIQGCKEVYGKAINLLVELASLQVSLLTWH